MAPLPDAALDHYARQQRLTASVVSKARDEWKRMGGYVNDLDAGWRQVGPRLEVLTTAAQTAAARDGASYIADTLDEMGDRAPAAGIVEHRALAGIASDGRPLGSLLQGAVVSTKQAIAAGASPQAALAGTGSPWLDAVIQTQLADAARVSAGVAMTARPRVTGYIRLLNPPSCSRCVVLAGRWFGWNSGFARHPKCDCRHVPAPAERSRELTADPQAYFDSLSRAEQDRTFTNAGAQAIRDGADPSQVVNARRGALGLTTASGRRTDALGNPLGRRLQRDSQGRATTTDGVTRRGYAGAVIRSNRRKSRLMPESIYEQAGDDRDEAIRLLRVNGYLNT